MDRNRRAGIALRQWMIPCGKQDDRFRGARKVSNVWGMGRIVCNSDMRDIFFDFAYHLVDRCHVHYYIQLRILRRETVQHLVQEVIDEAITDGNPNLASLQAAQLV